MIRISSSASFISSGFCSGYAPKAPGTVGSVAAVCAWLLASWLGLLPSMASHIAAALFVIVIGTWATKISLDEEGGEDPQWIVIDEWAGIFIALIGTGASNFLHVALAFALFRLFDILKPGPVSKAEELPGAFGIMADDIVAGIGAVLSLSIIRIWI
jgi:phosphatidylglycerophosphatase A